MTGDDNWPVTERYRLKALAWVKLEAAASILEETKSAVLSQKMQALMRHEDLPVSRAEMLVKASPEWNEHIHKMVQAREAASYAKVEMEVEKMRFNEQMSAEATARAERRM